MRFGRGAKPMGGLAENLSGLKDSTSIGTATCPVALLVLGMSRSGTSALTRVLSLCGATLPFGMMGADEGNQRGYWEPRASLLMNRAILERHRSAWWDPSMRVLEEGEFSADEKAACVSQIAAYLNTLPAAPLIVIKDLSIVPISEMWFEAAHLAGFNVRVVIAVRHPQEVIGSLSSLAEATPELSSALWLKANLLAERHTRGMPRVFVDYANLLENWRREITRVSAGLEVDLHTRDENAIEEFLTPDLRRQRSCDSVTDFFGTNWVSVVYDAVRAAARDEPWDESVLDRVFEAYRASEHDFRTAFEASRDLSSSMLNRFFRPSIMRPILEVVALAHRRRGTWA
jgi:hypothetical protein